MRYSIYSSHSDKHTHVICPEGKFDTLPTAIRHRGPWRGGREGEIRKLRKDIRLAIAIDGFALIQCHPLELEPEGD